MGGAASGLRAEFETQERRLLAHRDEVRLARSAQMHKSIFRTALIRRKVHQAFHRRLSITKATHRDRISRLKTGPTKQPEFTPAKHSASSPTGLTGARDAAS